MSAAPDLNLRPGWYPDPRGEQLYREFDGRDWTDRTAPVPASRRAQFQQQRSALARRSPGYATSASAGARSPSGRSTAHLRAAGVRADVVDPGRSFGIAAFVCAILLSWFCLFIPLILARMSRTRSNSAGLPRNGYAMAALIMSLVQLVIGIVVIAILVVVMMSVANDPHRTSAKINARSQAMQLTNAIETCAANNSNGMYGACTRQPARATRSAPELRGKVTICRGTAMPAAGMTCVAPIGQQGYVVRSTASNKGTTATYVERHGPDGSITKSCSGKPC